MRSNPAQNSELRANKRRMELELVLLASDRSKFSRSLETMRAENKKLKLAEKNIALDLLRNAALIRKEEAELRRIDADIAQKKKKLNTLR